MSKLDGYKPFTAVSNAINRLANQGLIRLVGDKERIAELVTQELIQAGVFREFINLVRPYPTNVHNNLEEFITEGGRVVFIDRMRFDSNQGLFTLDLKFDPESKNIDKTLVFREVREFEEIIDEEEDADCIESIIGLDQYSTLYVLKTDGREISFSSSATPEIRSPNQ